MSDAIATTAGWQAELAIGVDYRAGRSRLAERRQRGPLAIQRPFYPEGEDLCHLYLLHPPGGVVGGDTLTITLNVASDSAALVTTPGASKFYRSGGPRALQQQRLGVASGASLEWLPQESIYFPGALVTLRSQLHLAEGARFIGWEIHCLGRSAAAEPFDHGQLDLGWQVWLPDRPLLIDQLAITPSQIAAAALLRHAAVVATLYATPANSDDLARVNAALPPAATVGATLIEHLLVVRYLGDSGEACRHLFSHLWAILRPTIIGRHATPPRIWAT
jgi:urease accessory protein